MICSTCQLDVEKYANGKKCRKCYNEYMREYQLVRYYKLRAECIALLGGKCVDCGTTDRLEFDHMHRFGKKYTLGSIMLHSKKKREEELSKCVLRCTYCHSVKTSIESSVDHGGGLTGKRNCYCTLCKPLKKEYNRKWRERNKK